MSQYVRTRQLNGKGSSRKTLPGVAMAAARSVAPASVTPHPPRFSRRSRTLGERSAAASAAHPPPPLPPPPPPAPARVPALPPSSAPVPAPAPAPISVRVLAPAPAPSSPVSAVSAPVSSAGLSTRLSSVRWHAGSSRNAASAFAPPPQTFVAAC